MSRVLLEKQTGKLIEYQTDATPGTLIENIKSNPQYGYSPDQVEEKEVTSQEWADLRQKWIIEPVMAQDKADEGIRLQKQKKIQSKLGLSDQEFQDLKDALSG